MTIQTTSSKIERSERATSGASNSIVDLYFAEEFGRIAEERGEADFQMPELWPWASREDPARLPMAACRARSNTRDFSSSSDRFSRASSSYVCQSVPQRGCFDTSFDTATSSQHSQASTCMRRGGTSLPSASPYTKSLDAKFQTLSESNLDTNFTKALAGTIDSLLDSLFSTTWDANAPAMHTKSPATESRGSLDLASEDINMQQYNSVSHRLAPQTSPQSPRWPQLNDTLSWNQYPLSLAGCESSYDVAHPTPGTCSCTRCTSGPHTTTSCSMGRMHDMDQVLSTCKVGVASGAHGGHAAAADASPTELHDFAGNYVEAILESFGCKSPRKTLDFGSADETVTTAERRGLVYTDAAHVVIGSRYEED